LFWDVIRDETPDLILAAAMGAGHFHADPRVFPFVVQERRFFLYAEGVFQIARSSRWRRDQRSWA
jgi:hypothetical protein